MRTLFAILLTLSLLFVQPVFADDVVLTHIGGLATQSKKPTHWYYMPQRVILKGTGSKGANIDITLDGKFNVTKASLEDGSWQYDLGTLEIADHNVIVASGNTSYSFILTIGSAAPAQETSSTPTELPKTGDLLSLAGLLGVAGTLIYVGFRKSSA